jgi:DNA-binding response OmpR family regulator
MAQKEITILEDDRDIREICTYFFTSEGFSVNGYGTAKEFADAPPTTNIFLLDISLPDGNGLDICQKIKKDQRFKDVPVIIMSAHMTEAALKAQPCTAEHFISKPFNLDSLLNVVVKLIG